MFRTGVRVSLVIAVAMGGVAGCVDASKAELPESITTCPGNSCGGCELLEAEPGQPCGECGGGTWRCANQNELSCIGGTPINGCGGCTPLPGRPERACGPCNDGSWRCDGTDALICEGGTPGNVCGGCGPVNGARGDPCGFCGGGQLACRDGALLCEGANPTNACGGCGPIVTEPFDVCDTCDDPVGTLFGACGACGDGRWVCADSNTFVCEGNRPHTDACYGCSPITVQPGASCGGNCGDGEFACVNRAFVCQGETEPNACTGCEPLDGVPGEPCGPCEDGTWQCAGINAVECIGATEGNACGGCGSLPNPLDSACSACGVWECDPDNVGEMRCGGASANECGGCASLANPPGGACGGPCGRYVCDSGMESTSCDDPPANACGGCAALTATPTDPCGRCGRWECASDNESVDCSDDGTTGCGAARVLSVVLHGDPCANDGECDTGEVCVDSDGNGSDDACAPAFDLRLDTTDTDSAFTFEGNTSYRTTFAGTHDLAGWRVDAALTGPAMWTHNATLAATDERTLILGIIDEAPVSCSDDTACTSGSCVNATACANYGIFSFTDDNIPIAGRVKVRVINMHIGQTLVDVTLDDGGGTPVVVNDLDYGVASSYLDLAPGTYGLSLADGAGAPLGSFGQATWAADEVHTVLVYQRPGGHLLAVLDDYGWTVE